MFLVSRNSDLSLWILFVFSHEQQGAKFHSCRTSSRTAKQSGLKVCKVSVNKMLGKYGVELYPKYADEWSVEGEILDVWWWWSVPQGIRIFECGPCFMVRKMNSLLSHTVISFCPSPVIWQTFIHVLVDRLLLGKVGKGIHTPCIQNGGFDWRRWDQGMASSDRTNFI